MRKNPTAFSPFFFLLVMTGRNMKAKTEPFCHGQHMFWWVSELFLPPPPRFSIYKPNICLPFWQLQVSALCRESLCWTRALVQGRNGVECYEESPCAPSAQTFCTATLSAAIKIQISHTSPAERILIKHGCTTIILGLLSAPVKSWQWHHIYTQMALSFYWLHCSSWVWKGNLPRLCGCRLEPAFIWSLCYRKNGPKWRKMGKPEQCLDSLANFPHSLSAPPF